MRLYLLGFLPLLAAQPHLENFRQQTRAVAGGLDATIRQIVAQQKDPAWIAYAVPQVRGERQMCCWNNQVQGCSLEPQEGTVLAPRPPGTVHLEGGTEFYVFLRVENQRIEKIRTFSMDCSMDGGGLPLHWLTGGTGTSSISLLESLVPASSLDGDRKMADGAITAIALHRDATADAALDRLTRPDQLENVRRQAAFWLGNARGRHGFETLTRLLREDTSEKVREHVIFALTQSKEAEALALVAKAAQEDRSPRVRQQALYWLAKRAPKPMAEAAIRRALLQDADVSVRKQATHALAQIPEGGGVPMLIETARGTRDEAVRKQAMHWLERSKDPRATRFFEEVLTAR